MTLHAAEGMLCLGALPRVGDTFARHTRITGPNRSVVVHERWLIVEVDHVHRAVTWDLYINAERQGRFTDPWAVFCAENAKQTPPLRYLPME